MIRRPKLKDFKETTTWTRYGVQTYWTFPGEYEGYDSFVKFQGCPYPLLFNQVDQKEIDIFLMPNLDTSIAHLNLKTLAGEVGLKFHKYARANSHVSLREWLCGYLERAWEERRREDAIFDGVEWWEKVFTKGT
jgi:hypothetical protein